MSPDILTVGELLVEIMRTELDTSHSVVGANYKGPFPSGAPAIFINSVARMGKPFHFTTGYIGVVGEDKFGDCIINKLEQDGVDISQIRISREKHTGIAFNQYNSDGSRKFIFAPGAAGETSPADIKEFYFEDIKNLHIMGSSLSISKNSRDACYKSIKIAKSKNPDIIISFDPNLRLEMLDLDSILKICRPVLETTDILLPSGEEAEMLAGIDNPIKACQKLLKFGPKIIALKNGNKGCMVFSQDDAKGFNSNGFKVNEIDPTGAGDSFGGAFIVGYLANWNLRKIARFANAVGALKVQTFGPMPDTTYKEVIDFMEKF
ncbi:MAG: sugar kinase [Promethearchaeota archaeon]|jgi:sugar/nucleoside kinase (ribokinase family)